MAGQAAARQDAQAELGCSESFAAPQAAAADGLAASELAPLAAFEYLQREFVDALTEGEVFAEADDIEGDEAAEVERQLGGGAVVVGGPVRVIAPVEDIGGGEAGVVAADVVGRRGGTRGEVTGEGRVEDAAEFAQGGDVGLVNAPAAVWRQVQQQQRPRPTDS